MTIEGDRRGPSPELTEEALKLIEAEQRPEAAIRVAEQLTDPHPEVRTLSKSLRADRFENSQRPGILRPGVKQRLDVTVYRPSVDRALRIMDAILKAFEARGWPVEVDDDHDEDHRHSSSTVVLEERVFFFLDEKTTRVDHIPTTEEKLEAKRYSWHHWPKYDFKPSGLLRLQIPNASYMGIRTIWTDGERQQRIENLLNDFMIGVVKAAVGIKKRRAEWAEAERRRQEETLRQIERDRLRALEEIRAKELHRQADGFEKVMRIRAYLAKAQETGFVYLPMDAVKMTTLQEWTDWATKYVDRIDPFRRDPDEEGDSESL